jgi:CRP-like cAMP-binding protein
MKMTIKHKLEIVLLSAGGLLGLVWAATTSHFPADWFTLDYLIDLSSLLTVASFSVRGMLRLRLLAVASQIIAIPYFVFQAAPLWTPVGWTVLFLAINLYHITLILLERRPIKFTAEEQRLYDLSFQTLEPREFIQLVKFGEWKTAVQGDKFLTRGEPITHIAVPITGTLTTRQGEEAVGQLGPGELIGAGIGLTGQPAAFDAEFAEDAHYMCWPVTDIQTFLGNNPELANKFNDVVNRYLVAQINKLSLFIGSRERVS